MQHERFAGGRFDEGGQLVLLLGRVDVGVAGVVEDPEQVVEPDVHARGLNQGVVEGLDAQPAGGDLGPDVAIGEQHPTSVAAGLWGQVTAGAYLPARHRGGDRPTLGAMRTGALRVASLRAAAAAVTAVAFTVPTAPSRTTAADDDSALLQQEDGDEQDQQQRDDEEAQQAQQQAEPDMIAAESKPSSRTRWRSTRS